MNVPPGRDKIGRDELGANVTLAEGFLVHEAIVKKVRQAAELRDFYGSQLSRLARSSIRKIGVPFPQFMRFDGKELRVILDRLLEITDVERQL